MSLHMKKRKNISIILILLLLTGCMNNSRIEVEREVSLLIGYQSISMFNDRYGNLLEVKYPNLDYVVMSMTELIEQNAASYPDIMYVPTEHMQDLIDAGTLLDLETIIKKEQLDLSLFEPEVIEYARSFGDGKLYGIPTAIYGQYIVYNKDIFDTHFIDYPLDGMTWDEILNIAQQFPDTGLAVFGLMPSQMIWEVGQTYDLHPYHPQDETVKIVAEEWEEIWTTFIKMMKSGKLSFQPELFYENKAAMAILTAKDNKLVENHSNWQTVTMPIDPRNPENTHYTYVDGFYALSSKTRFTTEAFELLQLFTSPEQLRLEQAKGKPIISVYKKDTRTKVEQSILKLQPYIPVDPILPYEFYVVGEQIIRQIINDEMSVTDALSEMALLIESKMRGLKNEE